MYTLIFVIPAPIVNALAYSVNPVFVAKSTFTFLKNPGKLFLLAVLIVTPSVLLISLIIPSYSSLSAFSLVVVIL